MDKIDAKILDILQKDGRISMKTLSQEISMSVPSTTERVKKLEDKKMIEGYSAIVDPSAVGRPIQAAVMIKLNYELHDKFYDYVSHVDDIIEVDEVAGQFFALMKICSPDMPRFLKVVYELRELGGTETYFTIKKVKKIPCRVPETNEE